MGGIFCSNVFSPKQCRASRSHRRLCRGGYSPPYVDRIWGIWGSECNIPEAMFYLRKGDYIL